MSIIKKIRKIINYLPLFAAFILCFAVKDAYALNAANIYGINAGRYTVKSINYRVPYGVPAGNIKNLFYIKAGRKFSMISLEKTIKTLYASGYFSNVSVFANINKKLKLIYLKFVFFPKIYIKEVNIEGLKNTGISSGRIIKSVPFKKGGLIYKYYKTISIKKIKKIMSRGGYPSAKVSIKTPLLNGRPKYYAVNIKIISGRPVIISNIFVKFKLYYPKKKVEALIKKLVGKPLNLNKIHLLRKSIWDLYKNKGYLNSIITSPKITYISKRKAVITLNVHPGYKISFHFKGIKPLSENFVKNSVLQIKNVLIFDGGTFLAFQEVLKKYYMKQGYFFAEVLFKENKDKKDKKINLYYSVNKGSKVKIGKIYIYGYKPFSRGTIARLMRTRVTSFFNREYFCKNRLKNDVQNIKNYYDNEGYLSARVSYKLKFSPDKKSVAVTVNIDSGIPTTVKKVYITGLPAIFKSNAALTGYFLKMKAKPFRIITAENGKELLSTKLSDSGYVFSKVKMNVKFSKNKKYAYIYYEIKAGPRVRIKRILITGNTVTRTGFIKSLLLFKKGQFYDQRKILETQNRLYKRGIFNSAVIKIENPENEVSEKTVMVRVKDAKPLDLSFGAGYGTYTRYKGFIQIENNNLFGTGKSLSLRFSKSAIYTNLLLNYYDPAIYGYRGLAFNASGLDTDVITLNYTMHKEGADFSLIRRFDKYFKGLLSYGMFYDFLSGLNPGAKITPRDDGFTRISSTSLSFIYNTKNNIFNPTSGNLTNLRFSYSNFLIDSQINFFKIYFHSEEYIPFVYNTDFLIGARLGYIRPLSPTSQVPINERFFLGGRTTVRGFPQDSIGLVSLNPYGYPIGGDVMENYNLQLNIPVYKSINFFVFQDGGNVFLDTSDVRPLALYKSAGAGIMYLSPIGPISFSYGFILTREPYWPAGGVNFTVGTSF
jgi:outer membrane protein insertion porin family